MTIDDYLATLRDDQRPALQRLRRIIRAVSPRKEEALSYGMPAIRLDGRWVVWIAASARHCAIYGVRAVGDKLAGYDVSLSGTLRLRPDEPLPTVIVGSLVRTRIAHNAANKPEPLGGRR